MTTGRISSLQQLDPREIGERVRTARHDVHLSQAELARRAGLSRVSINQLENGKRSRVNPAVLRRVADILNTSELHFYGLADEPTNGALPVSESAVMSEPLLSVFERLVVLPAHQQAKIAQILESMFDWREMGLDRDE